MRGLYAVTGNRARYSLTAKLLRRNAKCNCHPGCHADSLPPGRHLDAFFSLQSPPPPSHTSTRSGTKNLETTAAIHREIQQPTALVPTTRVRNLTHSPAIRGAPIQLPSNQVGSSIQPPNRQPATIWHMKYTYPIVPSPETVYPTQPKAAHHHHPGQLPPPHPNLTRSTPRFTFSPSTNGSGAGRRGAGQGLVTGQAAKLSFIDVVGAHKDLLGAGWVLFVRFAFRRGTGLG
jgi:hypothetical protein